MSRIEFIPSDHVSIIFRTRICLDLNTINQLIVNVIFIVIILFAIPHLNRPRRLLLTSVSYSIKDYFYNLTIINGHLLDFDIEILTVIESVDLISFTIEYSIGKDKTFIIA